MTGLILTLTLTTVAAPTSANMEQVLVLKTGSAMTVQSFAVDGPLVRIVGLSGEALMVRTEQADLEASELATERHRERRLKAPAPAPERDGPTLASTRIRSDSVLDASRRALARGGRSAMSTTYGTSSADPEADGATATIAAYELAGGAREVVELSGTSAMTIGFRTRLSEEALAACQSGLRLFETSGEATVSSKTEASLTVQPKDGVVRLTLENLEAFPVSVEVFRK